MKQKQVSRPLLMRLNLLRTPRCLDWSRLDVTHWRWSRCLVHELIHDELIHDELIHDELIHDEL